MSIILFATLEKIKSKKVNTVTELLLPTCVTKDSPDRDDKNCRVLHNIVFDCCDTCIRFDMSSGKFNKGDLRFYFKTKGDAENNIASLLASTSSMVTAAEPSMAEREVQESATKKNMYQKNVPEKIKEVGRFVLLHSTKSAINKLSKIYPEFIFLRTTVNSWKRKIKLSRDSVDHWPPKLSKVGRPNLLDEVLLQKVKDIIVGTRLAGSVVNCKQVVCIGRGVVMANDPNLLRDFGGDLDLSEGWARRVLGSMKWVKRKGTTGKVEPSPQLLAEEKFTFLREIASAVYNNYIPKELIINLDQTPLSCVSPAKYMFTFRGSSNVPIKGVDDKRQITATFAISAGGTFLPIQVIYEGKTQRCLPKYEFPKGFDVTFSENHWSNAEKSVQFFKMFFLIWKRQKRSNTFLTIKSP